MGRSWWGWGNDEDAVTGAELRELLDRVRALTSGELVDHRPPDIASLALPRPRTAPPAALAALCSDDPGDRAAHAHGKAYRDVVRNLHGDLRHVPDLVARPRDEREVTDLLDWCTRENIAVIPYGGGTSVVGGVEPRCADDHPAVVTLDLGRMDRVLETDRTSRAARVQAGVLGPRLEEQLRPEGLTLRHFPQSYEFSSLGGWLATRAGGHYATLYTHIDDLVESMRVVTPSGVSASRRLPGSGAGPSPDRLFLGSEGTLGIITEAWLRLRERPRRRAGASVRFEDFDAAVTATRAVAQSGLNPANCRLLDAAEALLNAGVSTGGGVLVLAFESADHPVRAHLDRAVELCRDHGGTPSAPKSRTTPERDPAADAWRSSFLRMPYQRDALARHAVIAETFETACTWDRFEALHRAVTEAARDALREVTGTGVVTCRLTHVYPDGPAPYFGVYAPGRWGSTVAQWDHIKAAVSEAIATHGGTITHHHAVGRDHRPWYDRQRPGPFAAALTAAKAALDPAGILNPGVLLPAPGRARAGAVGGAN
ncbi:FAD-binding oxidoreductase [Streptomyces sp. LP11]|uniref:FAD-binding oxidoreductase n=1 Tax=Streptomyces pyxinicus TaxID=2970331 RepID=A0ABT2BAG7_9ACTN|nr:FAD-binding oxidoreductase [Streptomyces sp. LP11]MCS0605514.1 FAD-binding oxidoreductase [Streptomyces sp. LP11]